MSNSTKLDCRGKTFLATALMSTLISLAGTTSAALTDLTNAPLVSSTSAQVKPNVLFVLDDSGSMAWKYMPDDLAGYTNTVGFRNAACNYVYYNPSVTYVVPKTSIGTDVNSASPTSFNNAYNDGFYAYDGGSASSKTNLGTSFKAVSSDTAQPAYYWTYLGATTLTPLTGDCQKTLTGSGDTTTTEICTDGTRGTSASTCASLGKTALWRKVIVSSSSGPGGTDERQNFANWYSYYSTRILMMKSASGRAFLNLSDAYRVGFMTIHPGTYSFGSGYTCCSTVDSAKFLGIADFDTTHKSDWYSKLYSQTTGSSTPLRTALTVAGRYYAGKNDHMNTGMVPSASADPVQYSCQQNFTILTTDGYWNDGSGYQMNGTTVMDNQDGVLSELDAYNPAGSKFAVSPRPIFDGAQTVYVWNTATNAYRYASCTTPATQQKTVQWQSRTVQPQQRTSTLQSQTWQLQSSTSSLQSRTAVLQRRTSNNSGSTWTAWSNVSSCTWDNSGSTRTQCQYLSWSGWSNAASCTPLAQGTSTSQGVTWSGPAVECQYTAWSSWNNVASCTTAAQDTSGTWSVPTATQCQYVLTSGPTNVASCTALPRSASSPYVVGTATECSYSAWSAWSNVASCTPVAQSTSSPYTVGTAVACQNTYGAWTNTTGSCTATSSLQCQSVDVTAWTNVTSCTPVPPNASGQEILCQSVASTAGNKIQYKATTTATSYPGPNQGGTAISSNTTTGSWTNLDGVCYPNGLEPAFPSTTVTSGPPAPPAGCSSGVQVWPCEIVSNTGGSSNTLADVAQYYYKNDLRSPSLGNCSGALGASVDVCVNNVPATGTGNEDDKAQWQHMTTFTMGLGLSGTLQFQSDYKTATTGDFADIRAGNKNWPTPAADAPTALDDLWHAAVNGRGQYFSASNPDTVVTGLSSALAGISARVAAAAAAATSNLEPVEGDNFVYIPKYITQKWTGDLESHEIDLTTGTVGGSVIWSAQAKLDALAFNGCDKRTIKLFRAGATNNMVDFKWNTYGCDASNAPTGTAQTTLNATEQANFTSISSLSQYATMTDGTSGTADQRTAGAGANLVNYLRGQRGKEGYTSNDINKLYRTRDHLLGDIVDAQPVHVRGAFAEYNDAGYAAYKTATETRVPMLYAASNDGMLHAFYAGTSVADAQGGVEAWAFIPTQVLPNLYKLADTNYASLHQFYVDGTPSAGDVFDTTASSDCALATPTAPQNCWKTILVGGLRKGGKGYYALDITDPANPKALWEFNYSTTCYDGTAATAGADCHLGYSYGNPIISKLADGTWVVFVTSGYNNVNSPSVAGDGQGYLYVLNAITGKIIYKISTGAGSATNPSGLARINVWLDNGIRDNRTQRVYGTDLLGNIWRFDVNDTLAPSGREATLVAQVTDSAGVPQPITTTPELGQNDNAEPIVFVATGQYLGTTDLSSTQTQTVWAIRDPLTPTALTGLRSTLAQIVITNAGSGTTAYRTASCASNCSSADGWFADLPDSGERVNVDIQLQLGTLVVASNVPSNNACTIGGYSWLNYFNYATGLAVAGATNDALGQRAIGSSGTDALTVGFNVVRLPSGKTIVIGMNNLGEPIAGGGAFATPGPQGHRIGWREITQ